LLTCIFIIYLLQVSQREAAIRSRPDSAAAEFGVGFASGGSGSIEDKSKDLSDAIGSLPAILAKKANLEAHTNILHAVMRKVAARELPTFFEQEQSMLSSGGGRAVDRSAVLTLLRDGSKGSLEDKARLLCLMAVATADMSSNKASNEELDAAFMQGCLAVAAAQAPVGTAGTGVAAATLSAGGATTNKEAIDNAIAAANFLRKLQALQSGPAARFGGGGSSAAGAAALQSFLTSAQSRASSLIAKATSYFAKSTPFYVTRTVDNLSEGRACAEDEAFCYLDPLRTATASVAGAVEGGPGSGQKYSDVIVFVMGGGCYSELHNLQELLGTGDGVGVGSNGGSAAAASVSRSASGSAGTSGRALRNIMYGCTDIVSGEDFLNQLIKLGMPSGSVAR
jgi:hypothetical protein